MAETATTEDFQRFVELVSSLSEASEAKGHWQTGRFRLQEYAQDQYRIEIAQGNESDTYKALKVDSKDAQSDAARSIRLGERYVLLSDVQALLSPLSSAWNLAEETTETGTLSVATPKSNERKYDEHREVFCGFSDESSPDRLSAELLSLNADNNWARLGELILAAEDFDFTTEQSEQLAPRLLNLATRHRDSDNPQDAPVIFSAIRTGASMLRPNEAGRLLELLEPGHLIDTSIVALKMVGRVFEAQPPEALDQHTDLAGEVLRIAKWLLNRYAIASSQSAAMAQLAVYALAAMASSETMSVMGTVRQLGVPWFVQQTTHRLRQLRDSWGRRSVPVAPAVLDLLDRATQET